MIYLLVNVSSLDYSINIDECVKKYIDYLEDDTFDFLKDGIELDVFLNSKLRIKKEISSTFIETPTRIDLTLINEINNAKVEYKLPSVYYGIDNKICYVYSIILPKSKENISEEEKEYNKIINELLYKINNGLKTKDYKENIIDITHSFIISLNIFSTLLKSKNITDIEAVPYIPINNNKKQFSISNELLNDIKIKTIKNNNM